MNPFEYQVVKEPSKSMRSMARQTLQGRWKEAGLVVLVFYAFTVLPSALLSLLPSSSFANGAVGVYNLMVRGPLSLGICAYYLKVFRQQPGGLEDMLRGFNFMWKSLHLLLLIGIRVFFLSLLLIIPGIIAAIRYSQAFYILADNPDKSVRQVLFESSMMMRGNLLKFVGLQLSFLGWFLLASLPPALVTARRIQLAGLEMTLSESGPLAVAALPDLPVYILNLGTVFVSIYMGVAAACFYDLAKGNLQVHRGEVEELHA